jgi:hypothetical protein
MKDLRLDPILIQFCSADVPERGAVILRIFSLPLVIQQVPTSLLIQDTEISNSVKNNYAYLLKTNLKK